MLKVRLSNFTITTSPALAITCDVELLDGPLLPTTPIPPIDPPAVPDPLPPGFDTDTGVGLAMLRAAMWAAGLTPIGVQGKGAQIIAALKSRYPALDVYLSPSDAPVWPGFGSVDVTIDSGKGGWAFQPDAPSKPGRVPWQPVGHGPR